MNGIDLSEYTMAPAVPRGDLRANMAIMGPSGAGKSFTALRIMHYLLGMDPEKIKAMSEEEYNEYIKTPRIAVVDTEAAAVKYSNRKKFGLCFHHTQVRSCAHSKLREAIKMYAAQGYRGLIVDSFSSYWDGEDGFLELSKKLQGHSNNSWDAWATIKPLERALHRSLLTSGMHVIVTMQAKMEYVPEKNDKGKTEVKKIGLEPVQRKGIEYQFDIVGSLTIDHEMSFNCSRAPELNEAIIKRPTGNEIAALINDWLDIKHMIGDEPEEDD